MSDARSPSAAELLQLPSPFGGITAEQVAQEMAFHLPQPSPTGPAALLGAGSPPASANHASAQAHAGSNPPTPGRQAMSMVNIVTPRGDGQQQQ
jgi:hypothetical protein